jgi:hypothetical protein
LDVESSPGNFLFIIVIEKPFRSQRSFAVLVVFTLEASRSSLTSPNEKPHGKSPAKPVERRRKGMLGVKLAS